MPASEGQFGLTQISGAAGLFIRFGQWLIGDGFENYEHAAVAIDDTVDGSVHVMEAEPGGARISTYGISQFAWSDMSLTLEQKQAISAAAVRYKNVPYSFLDYLAIALHKWHIPVPGLKRYISSTKHQICSQLVDQCYKDAGIQLFHDGRWPGYVTPGDLYKLMTGKEKVQVCSPHI
jgi:hypothetical protein